MIEDRFRELLGFYLLGELSADEERGLERHLEECPECQRELARIQQTHDRLRELATGEPPPELKARVLAAVANEPRGRHGVRWRLWVPVAAAMMVFGILGLGLAWSFVGEPPAKVPLTATALAPGAGGEARVEKMRENVRVELEVWSMPELTENQYYEMWYYAESGDRISCGTFRVGPEGQTTVTLTAPVNARRYPEIEITREPGDGDPRPSGREVLEGELLTS